MLFWDTDAKTLQLQTSADSAIVLYPDRAPISLGFGGAHAAIKGNHGVTSIGKDGGLHITALEGEMLTFAQATLFDNYV